MPYLARIVSAAALVACLVPAGAAFAGSRAHAAATSFSEPKVISSHNGVLRATLVAGEGSAMIDGKLVSGLKLFNGTYPGPTLKANPGDKVELTFVNKLPEPTNMHFHGFRVTPANIGDNVLRTMLPAVTTRELAQGLSYRVAFTIPKVHQQGLYWYHPHHHGHVDDQVYAGLTGLIEVGDPLADLPQLKGITERLLALTAIQVTPGGKLNTSPAVRGELNLVNGQRQPALTIRPGETQLWRVGNISNENWYKLELTGHVFHVIGEDGNPVPRLRTENYLLLAPGKRFELLVQGGKAGSYVLRSLAFNQGFKTFGQFTLTTVVSAGVPMTPRPLPTTVSPHEATEQQNTLDSPIARKRTLTFSIDKPFPKDAMAFRINGKLFSETRTDQVVRLDTTEEWLIRNTSPEDHPFHIHTNDFLVTAIDGRLVQPDGFQDVVRVKRQGSVTIRMRFREFAGKAVYHCHILFHEDHGMMGIIEFKR